MKKINITRNKGWYGRFRTALILADDVEIGRVKSGETVSVQVPNHSTNLYVKMDWGLSEPYSACGIQSEQTIYMNSWFTLNLQKNIGANAIPIALEDEPR